MHPTVGDEKAAAHARTCLESLSDSVDSRLSSFFGDLGESLAIRPYTWIGITFVVFAGACSGFGKFYSQNENIWQPQDTETAKAQLKFTSLYDNPFYVDSVILVPTDTNSNALDKANLVSMMELHDKVELIETEVSVDNTLIKSNLTSLCYPMPSAGHPCFIKSILELWNYDMATLVADTDVQTTMAAKSFADLDLMLGGFAGSAGSYTAEALKLTYFLENREVMDGAKFEDPPAKEWEGGFLDAMAVGCPANMKCYYQAARSFGDEFGGAIKGDVVLMNIGFLIIILYLSFNLGSCCGGVKSRVTSSMMSVLAIGLAIGASMGFSSYFDQPYTNLHSVLPFVMLGLGVDDSFVIQNAFDQTNVNDDMRVRMRQAMSHSGVSITVTSMTDFVAFMISTTTSLPALASFCFYAATGILFLFMFQCTMFGAAVVLDGRRQLAGKRDFLDCCSVCRGRSAKPITQEDMKRGIVSIFMKEKFGPFVTNKTVRPFLLMFSFALLGIGIFGASKMEVKSNLKAFIPDGSYVLDTMDMNELYFPNDATSVSIVTEQMDYFANQAELAAIPTKLKGKAHLQDTTGPTFDSWFSGFTTYLQEGCYGSCSGVLLDSDGLSTDEDQFYTNLQSYLNGPGGRYASSVVFTPGSTTNIVTAKMSAIFKGEIEEEAMEQVEAMDQIRAEMVTWEIPSYPYSFAFITWETYVIIQHEMVVNVALCMAAVFVITLILIANPTTALLVFISVGFAIAEIVGAMYFSGLIIDNVSVIYLTLAVGLAVDYAAHIGHCFMLKEGDNRSERVIDALADIGSPVLNGAISTFLAVVVLGASKSYVFRCMFIQFFLTVIFGLFNGIFFLPVLLCYVGPKAYGGAGKHKTATDKDGKPMYEAPSGGGSTEMVAGKGSGEANL